MDVGRPTRLLTVEPIVDPVPDRDFPDRSAETAPAPVRPTPRAGAGRSARRDEVVVLAPS